MRMLQRLVLGLLLLGGGACEQEYVEREIGYQGRARVNPWLAAERFAQRFDFAVESLTAWRAPAAADALWFVPAAILNNESFVRRAEVWSRRGGHLVVLLEHAAADTNDWRDYEPEVPLAKPLLEMLQRVGLEVREEVAHDGGSIRFDGEYFVVGAKSHAVVEARGAPPGVFACVSAGAGRISVLTDARIFRNRWIADHEHADFLLALLEATEQAGTVVFVRASGLSFWDLLCRHWWPVLGGLLLLLVLWLWRNLQRFGPLEAATVPPAARGYEHHLEALGNFHWRLDRAAALLVPLREQIVERGQRCGSRAGPLDETFLELLAARSGMPSARISRALNGPAPGDGVALTRMVADLQVLLQVLP
ncbi:MAG: hypothetical protein NTW21_21910 [Verrucomicrobia bacterium]|nr:hypothetical protein [Verrucomicrobiota bacterium]